MHELSIAGRRLLTYLVSRFPGVDPENPKTFVTYKQVHDAIGLRRIGPTYGVSLKSQGLIDLAGWTVATGRPVVTSLIVADKTREPGSGFFELVNYAGDRQMQRWVEEVAASKSYDWSGFVDPPVTAKKELKGAEGAAVWRLITHHESPKAAFNQMVAENALAVGWSDVGDLRELQPEGAAAITKALPSAYPDLNNAHLGGPSLWNLYSQMRVGDFVIVSGAGRLGVFQVLGEYFYVNGDGVIGYRHYRAAALTDIDAEKLWDAVGRNVARGQNIRWTLALCVAGPAAASILFHEGGRYEVRSTAIERNPAARNACLSHHGRTCFVCGFDFESFYGAIGAGYIHVHHRKDISLSTGRYEIDPVKDLVPLCPNCHAMVHTVKPAMRPENLRLLLKVSTRRA